MNNVGTIDPSMAGGVAMFFASFLMFFIFLALAFYVFSSICLMKIAKKTNTPNGWMAWIPVLNFILMLQIAQKPLWWAIVFFISLFIPVVNVIASIVITIMIGITIAKRLKKPEWTGWLFFISPINLIILGYWAFSKDEAVDSSPQPTL